MGKIVDYFGMSDSEKESAQAFFVLLFLVPMAINGWIGIFRIYEPSLRVAFLAASMAVFSVFAFYSSIWAFIKNKSLVRGSGCGFALLYFSIIILAYGFLLYVLGHAPARFNSALGNGYYSQYLKYSLYYFFPACLLIHTGRILEKKPETVLSVASEKISVTTEA